MKLLTSFSFFIFCLIASIASLTTSTDPFSAELRQTDVNRNNEVAGGGGSRNGGGGVGGGYFGPGSGFNIPGLGSGFGNGIIPGGGYGAGYGGPNGGYSRGGVTRPSVVCRVKGPCYQKKLRCPPKCFSSFSRGGKNYGAGGGGGGCTIDCKKKCIAYC